MESIEKTSREIHQIVNEDQFDEFVNKVWLPADKAISKEEHERKINMKFPKGKRDADIIHNQRLELIQQEKELQEFKSKSVLIADVEKIIEKIKYEMQKTDSSYNKEMKDNPEWQRFARGYVAGMQFTLNKLSKLKSLKNG